MFNYKKTYRFVSLHVFGESDSSLKVLTARPNLEPEANKSERIIIMLWNIEHKHAKSCCTCHRGEGWRRRGGCDQELSWCWRTSCYWRAHARASRMRPRWCCSPTSVALTTANPWDVRAPRDARDAPAAGWRSRPCPALTNTTKKKLTHKDEKKTKKFIWVLIN